MAIHTDHDISELDGTLAKVQQVRDICADPEVELISMPDHETAIIATWHLGIQSANAQVTTRFLSTLAPKPENVVHTDWHTFTHRRDLNKVVCHLSHDNFNILAELADSMESSIDDAICWLIGRYVTETHEDTDD
jgi:hypothetical protein